MSVTCETCAVGNTYNGWTNYETWTVNLFITNESNECIREATQAALRDNWGDHLKEFVEEYFCTDPCTMEPIGNLFVQQMLGAAMAEVNWQEVRDHLVADYAGEVERHCGECGQRITDDPDGGYGVLVHLDENGERDYDQDEDHGPYEDAE